MKIYDVTDYYINYLREDPRLQNVFSNKEDDRIHPRKYLGAVFKKNGLNYFIPFASPKKSDYDKRTGKIRKSIVPIIRMTAKNKKGELELKGTLKLSNMIPIPNEELIYYDINKEEDPFYKDLLIKEYEFIKKNQPLILKYANTLYNQKTKEDILFPTGINKPRYLDNVVDYKYAEEKCIQFCKEHNIKIPGRSVEDLINGARTR